MNILRENKVMHVLALYLNDTMLGTEFWTDNYSSRFTLLLCFHFRPTCITFDIQVSKEHSPLLFHIETFHARKYLSPSLG